MNGEYRGWNVSCPVDDRTMCPAKVALVDLYELSGDIDPVVAERNRTKLGVKMAEYRLKDGSCVGPDADGNCPTRLAMDNDPVRTATVGFARMARDALYRTANKLLRR